MQPNFPPELGPLVRKWASYSLSIMSLPVIDIRMYARVNKITVDSRMSHTFRLCYYVSASPRRSRQTDRQTDISRPTVGYKVYILARQQTSTLHLGHLPDGAHIKD